MTEPDRHLEEQLDDWIDGRLAAAERAEVERHLDRCPDCRSRRDALVATRAALRDELPETPLPAGFEARIRAALDREDERSGAAAGPAPARSARLPGLLPLAAGLLLAVVASLLLLRPAESRDVVASAFREHARLVATGLPATLRAADATAVQARWQAAELDFPARVLDLSAMGITLVGGDATRLGELPAARSVYSGEIGSILCWMFRGAEEQLPEPAEIRRQRGFTFRVYRQDDATLVIWREGEVLCALAAAADAETVLSLAVAKAMAPAAARSS